MIMLNHSSERIFNPSRSTGYNYPEEGNISHKRAFVSSTVQKREREACSPSKSPIPRTSRAVDTRTRFMYPIQIFHIDSLLDFKTITYYHTFLATDAFRVNFYPLQFCSL